MKQLNGANAQFRDARMPQQLTNPYSTQLGGTSTQRMHVHHHIPKHNGAMEGEINHTFTKIFHETQPKGSQHCQVPALNMMAGKQLLTGEAMIKYCETINEPGWGVFYQLGNPETGGKKGNLYDCVINRWLMQMHGCKLVISTIIEPNLSAKDLSATQQKTAELTGMESFVARSIYSVHAFAIRRCARGIWWHLDSNLQQEISINNSVGSGNGFILYQLTIKTPGEAPEVLMRCVERVTLYQE